MHFFFFFVCFSFFFCPNSCYEVICQNIFRFGSLLSCSLHHMWRPLSSLIPFVESFTMMMCLVGWVPYRKDIFFVAFFELPEWNTGFPVAVILVAGCLCIIQYLDQYIQKRASVLFGQVHSSHRYLWSPHRPLRNFCCSWRTACQATRSLKANRRKTPTAMMRMQKKRRLQESDNQNTKWSPVWHARLNNTIIWWLTIWLHARLREKVGGGGLRSWGKCSKCVQLGFQGYEIWAAREPLGVWLLSGKSVEKMIWVTQAMLPTRFEVWSSLMTWLRVIKPDDRAEGYRAGWPGCGSHLMTRLRVIPDDLAEGQVWWPGWGLSSLMTRAQPDDLAVGHTRWLGWGSCLMTWLRV